MGRKTPKELFTRMRKDVSHIHIFENVCYCHVHADNRKKLDPSKEKGYLLGTMRFRRDIEFTFLLEGGLM